MSFDARLSTWPLRLQKRYLASQELDKEDNKILQAVTPVTNTDELLRDYRAIAVVIAVSGTGLQSYALATKSKYRFVVQAISAKVASGTFGFNRIELGLIQTVDKDTLEDLASTITGVRLATFTNNSQIGVTGFFHPFALNQGDFVSVNVDTFTGAGNLEIELAGYREAIF